MSRCPTCGKTYSDDAKFCTRDGTRLFTPGDAASRNTAPTPRADRPGGAGGGPSRGNLVGSTLQGRYEIIRKIGEGGMSFVYLANDVSTGERYAIKVLSAA